MIFKHEVEHDFRYLTVKFGDDSCNGNKLIKNVKVHPLISTENVYCCFDLDRDQAHLVDICWVVLQWMTLQS